MFLEILVLHFQRTVFILEGFQSVDHMANRFLVGLANFFQQSCGVVPGTAPPNISFSSFTLSGFWKYRRSSACWSIICCCSCSRPSWPVEPARVLTVRGLPRRPVRFWDRSGCREVRKIPVAVVDCGNEVLMEGRVTVSRSSLEGTKGCCCAESVKGV